MRYLGNKTKLLSYIDDFLEEKDLINKNLTFMDAFCGTASVASFFADKFTVITNDLMYYSYIIAQAKLNTPKILFKKLKIDPFNYFNNVKTTNYTKGFVYNNFSPNGNRMYFSDENAKMIDFIRDTIDEWYEKEQITKNEKYYLIASLLESVSKVANVAGVYGAYLKTWDPRAIKKMVFMPIETTVRETNSLIYNEELISLLTKIKGDILYLDPPYTSTQYCSQYHVLETIAKNDCPTLHGISGQREHATTMSSFSRKDEVKSAFEELIANANFKHIILSYSPDGLLDKTFIENILKRYGKKETYECKEIDYKKYQNAKTESKKEHFEYLFYIEKKEPIFCSPLNYSGNKYDIIPFIKDNIPENIDCFYDLFGGGANVSININSNKIVYNDYNFIVKDLIKYIAETNSVQLYKYLMQTIKKYNLSKNNKESYNLFRDKYNKTPINKRDPRDLLLLIIFGFQNQIRFNSKLEFNNPVGLSDFNASSVEKLFSFSNEAKRKNIEFLSNSYSYYKDLITCNDFVYCDPPYLVTCGAYNDGKRGFNGWDEKQEMELLKFLSQLHSKNIRFMLSNILEQNNKRNTILEHWIKENNFFITECPLKTKKNRQEIIVTNYSIKR